MSQFNFNKIKEMADQAIEVDMYKKAKEKYPDIELSVKFDSEKGNFTFTGLSSEQVEELVRQYKQ